MDASEKIRLQQWASDMVDFQNSRLTRKQWCEVHGININTFGYRCTRVRHAAKEYEQLNAREQSRFVMVAPSLQQETEMQKATGEPATESCMVIYFDHAALRIPYDAPVNLVRTILEVLSNV
ncbi:MAG: hypothetical protein LKE86_10110 [Eubacterium sp.]|nr:hypothetical protein [Eubacterium sp.]MCH4007494.1 hypothetical protein [Eubacterium sp.]MCH4046545.1 hypothetical protein [Eubacterium sp.]MCH4047748.1 hypothetical protein [Eubacterium sp.]MCH4078520.1 hypothetical protein [Eubacterium sp.]